jgi:uncharacterized protein YdcH (DUF465 family)
MESKDRQRILGAVHTNSQLKRLYKEHEILEAALERFSRRSFLTSEEQAEEARLKREKLKGVDRMMALLSDGAMAAEAH